MCSLLCLRTTDLCCPGLQESPLPSYLLGYPRGWITENPSPYQELPSYLARLNHLHSIPCSRNAYHPLSLGKTSLHFVSRHIDDQIHGHNSLYSLPMMQLILYTGWDIVVRTGAVTLSNAELWHL